MKIKKGDKFLCIRSVYMNEDNKQVYTKDKEYISEVDNCITDDEGDKHHYWVSTKDGLEDYFILISHDKVNHPSHYTWLKKKCGIEVIDITRHMDFCSGNAVKYLLRAGHKTEEGYSDKQKEIEDLKKAIWYIEDKIKQLNNE